MKTWSLIAFRQGATGIIAGMRRSGCVFIGGSFGEGNLQVLCTVCNARKGDDCPVLVLTAPMGEEPFQTANGR